MMQAEQPQRLNASCNEIMNYAAYQMDSFREENSDEQSLGPPKPKQMSLAQRRAEKRRTQEQKVHMDIQNLKISSGEPSVSANSDDDDNEMKEHNEEPGKS